MKVFPMLVVLAWVMCFNSFGLRTDTGRAIVWTGNHTAMFGRYVEAIGHPTAHGSGLGAFHFPIGTMTGLKSRMLKPFLNISHDTVQCLNSTTADPNLGRFVHTTAGIAAVRQAEQFLQAINPAESD